MNLAEFITSEMRLVNCRWLRESLFDDACAGACGAPAAAHAITGRGFCWKHRSVDIHEHRRRLLAVVVVALLLAGGENARISRMKRFSWRGASELSSRARVSLLTGLRAPGASRRLAHVDLSGWRPVRGGNECDAAVAINDPTRLPVC